MRGRPTRTVSVTSTAPVNIRKTPAFPNDPNAYPVAFATLLYPSGGGAVQLYASNAFTGTLTVGTNAQNGDTIVLNGITFTFTSSTPTTNTQIAIGSTTAITAQNMADAFTQCPAYPTNLASYRVLSGAVVTVTYVGPGGPNNFTLANSTANRITASAANLFAGTTYGGGLTLTAGVEYVDVDQNLERWALASTGTISLAVTDTEY